jgi:hypothetical protein
MDDHPGISILTGSFTQKYSYCSISLLSEYFVQENPY